MIRVFKMGQTRLKRKKGSPRPLPKKRKRILYNELTIRSIYIVNKESENMLWSASCDGHSKTPFFPSLREINFHPRIEGSKTSVSANFQLWLITRFANAQLALTPCWKFAPRLRRADTTGLLKMRL